MRIPSGVVDQYIYFVAVDATDLKTRETGLSGFTVYRSRNGGVAAAYTTPTINETDTTNMPGVYELLLDEDMTIDAGDDSQEVCLHITHASMAPVTRVFELYRPKITAGETVTAANGAVDADIERLQGSVIATPTTAGVLEVDVTHIAGAAVNTSAAQLGVNVVNAGGTAWASGSLTSGVFAAGAITASAIAADAIGASELAADAVAEIADAVWDEDATAHQTQGTFGQAIGDPVADTNTIYKAVVTDATGATVGVDTTDILADTADMQPKLGTITNLGSGATIGANLVDIEGQTDDIGAAGAGLTAIPWNAAWDAEVQSEVEDGLVVHRLDELLNADSDIDGLAPPTVGSVFHEVLSKTAGSFTYDQTTDSLEAIRDKATDIETDTAEIGAAGAGLTNINLPDQTMNITGNITGNLSGSVGSVTGAVGSVTGAVGSVTGNVGGNVVGSVGSLAAQAKADVNAEVLDVLNVDTFAEPGQEAPAATNTLVKKIGYLFKFLRNKVTQNATTLNVYADDGTTVDQKATVSDDGVTYTRGEIGTGP